MYMVADVVSGAEPSVCSALTANAGSSMRLRFSRLMLSLRGVVRGFAPAVGTGETPVDRMSAEGERALAWQENAPAALDGKRPRLVPRQKENKRTELNGGDQRFDELRRDRGR